MLRCVWYVFAVMSCLGCSSLSLASSSRQLQGQGEVDFTSGVGLRQNPVQESGGYVNPELNTFLTAARSTGTDKVTKHNYHTLYGKYFQHMGGRRYIKKMLEIGLGCDMGYGPGRSSKLWRRYFPNSEIWQAEYDAECVKKFKGILDALDIKPLTGDQANVEVLKSWVDTSGGNFDYIIDDGGHSQMQMFQSMMVLFVDALKPGGVYFLEDLNTQRYMKYIDGDKKHNMLEIIKDWMELLLNNEKDGYPRPPQHPDHVYKPKWPLPPGLKTIDCALNMCAFTKCYDNDPNCSMQVMRQYKPDDNGVMTATWSDPPLEKPKTE